MPKYRSAVVRCCRATSSANRACNRRFRGSAKLAASSRFSFPRSGWNKRSGPVPIAQLDKSGYHPPPQQGRKHHVPRAIARGLVLAVMLLLSWPLRQPLPKKARCQRFARMSARARRRVPLLRRQWIIQDKTGISAKKTAKEVPTTMVRCFLACLFVRAPWRSVRRSGSPTPCFRTTISPAAATSPVFPMTTCRATFSPATSPRKPSRGPSGSTPSTSRRSIGSTT